MKFIKYSSLNRFYIDGSKKLQIYISNFHISLYPTKQTKKTFRHFSIKIIFTKEIFKNKGKHSSQKIRNCNEFPKQNALNQIILIWVLVGETLSYRLPTSHCISLAKKLFSHLANFAVKKKKNNNTNKKS